MRVFVVCWLLFVLLGAVAAVQIDSQTALLGKAGWDALGAGNAYVVAEVFGVGIRVDFKNAWLYFGVGTVVYLEWRDVDAKCAFERVLEFDFKLLDACVIFG